MREFISLHVKDSHLFASASLDLNYRGVTTIEGVNKEAAAGSTNAAGKSYFLGQLPGIAYNSTPLVKKRAKASSGGVQVRMKNGEHDYTLQRVMKDGKEKARIITDGDGQDVRLDYFQQRAEQLFGYTEDEFYSLIYLDSRRPNSIQFGSTSARRDFLISLFRLDKVDVVRKMFKAELDKIAESKIQYAEVKKQYVDLKERAPTRTKETIAEELEKAQLSMEKSQTKVDDVRALIEDYEAFAANKSTLNEMAQVLDTISRDAYLEALEKTESNALRLREKLNRARKFEKYQEDLKDYTTSRALVLAKAADSGVNLKEIETLRKAAEVVARNRADLETELRHTEKQLPRDYTPSEYNESLVDVDIKDMESRVAELRRHLQHAKQMKGGVCPTCGTELEGDEWDEASLTERLKKITDKLNRTLHAQREHGYQEILAKAKKIRKQLANVQQAVISTELLRMWDRLPDKPEWDEDEEPAVKLVETKYEAARDRLAFLRAHEPLIDRLITLHRRRREFEGFDLLATKLELSELQARSREIIARVGVLSGELNFLKSTQEQLQSLRKRGFELSKGFEDEEVLKLLVEAYGNSGIRKLMLQRLSTQLASQMNRFAKHLFSERYVFEVELDTQLHILYTKRVRGKDVTTDVRHLSGAESRVFSILMMLSLLSMMPASRRCNLLILDEPEWGMGEEMRENLGKFIPTLNKIIPHIIIISHYASLYPGARRFKVIKENEASRLVPIETQAVKEEKK